MASKRKSKSVASSLDNFGDVLQGAKAFADESDLKVQKRHEELLEATKAISLALSAGSIDVVPEDSKLIETIGRVANEIRLLRESMESRALAGPIEKLAEGMIYLGTRVMEYIEHKRSGVF